MAKDKENPFKAMMNARQDEPEEEQPVAPAKRASSKANPVEVTTAAPVTPAKPLSKRQDPEWCTRTYYQKKATDLDVEEELVALRREGIELDKSDLVEALFSSWVEYRRGLAPAQAWRRVSGQRKG